MTYTIVFNDKNEPEIRNNSLRKLIAKGDFIRNRFGSFIVYKVVGFTREGEIIAEIISSKYDYKIKEKVLTRPENYRVVR